MPSVWRNNGLSIVLGALFVLAMAGQAVAGWHDSNETRQEHGVPGIGLVAYLQSGGFWEATGENWESEFLQMAVFVLLTTFLRQKGSAESKRVDAIEEVDLDPVRFAGRPDAPGPVKRGGWRLKLYEHSLGLTFTALFLGSFAMHAAGGLHAYNEDQVEHGKPPVGATEYLASARFWFESFQNWQSEFLSLAAMVVGTIYLRQRGSAESKPVHASHDDTGR
jgi:hypothetical protein